MNEKNLLILLTIDGFVGQPVGHRARRLHRLGDARVLHPVRKVQQATVAVERIAVELRNGAVLGDVLASFLCWRCIYFVGHGPQSVQIALTIQFSSKIPPLVQMSALS